MASETAREALGVEEDLGRFERKAQAQVPDGLTRNATHQIRKFSATTVQSDSCARDLSKALGPFVKGSSPPDVC
jgi:3-methyladenine DNA glycosylase Tag